MNRNGPIKKLRLNKITLRNLTGEEAGDVNGGGMSPLSNLQHTVCNCHGKNGGRKHGGRKHGGKHGGQKKHSNPPWCTSTGLDSLPPEISFPWG